MKKLIFCLGFLVCLTTLASFQTDFEKGDKIVLTKDNNSVTFFIGKTTVEDVLNILGKAKIETNIWKFPGKTEKPLYGKRQTIEYKDKGLFFIFERDGVKYKKYALKDTCLLDEIIITSSDYCLDNVCIGTTKADIVKKFGKGDYGIQNGVADSTNLWYNSLGLTLTFDKSGELGRLKQIHRQETELYFKYKQKEAYKKSGIPFPSDSIK